MGPGIIAFWQHFYESIGVFDGALVISYTLSEFPTGCEAKGRSLGLFSLGPSMVQVQDLLAEKA